MNVTPSNRLFVREQKLRELEAEEMKRVQEQFSHSSLLKPIHNKIHLNLSIPKAQKESKAFKSSSVLKANNKAVIYGESIKFGDKKKDKLSRQVSQQVIVANTPDLLPLHSQTTESRIETNDQEDQIKKQQISIESFEKLNQQSHFQENGQEVKWSMEFSKKPENLVKIKQFQPDIIQQHGSSMRQSQAFKSILKMKTSSSSKSFTIQKLEEALQIQQGSPPQPAGANEVVDEYAQQNPMQEPKQHYAHILPSKFVNTRNVQEHVQSQQVVRPSQFSVESLLQAHLASNFYKMVARSTQKQSKSQKRNKTNALAKTYQSNFPKLCDEATSPMKKSTTRSPKKNLKTIREGDTSSEEPTFRSKTFKGNVKCKSSLARPKGSQFVLSASQRKKQIQQQNEDIMFLLGDQEPLPYIESLSAIREQAEVVGTGIRLTDMYPHSNQPMTEADQLKKRKSVQSIENNRSRPQSTKSKGIGSDRQIEQSNQTSHRVPQITPSIPQKLASKANFKIDDLLDEDLSQEKEPYFQEVKAEPQVKQEESKKSEIQYSTQLSLPEMEDVFVEAQKELEQTEMNVKEEFKHQSSTAQSNFQAYTCQQQQFGISNSFERLKSTDTLALLPNYAVSQKQLMERSEKPNTSGVGSPKRDEPPQDQEIQSPARLSPLKSEEERRSNFQKYLELAKNSPDEANRLYDKNKTKILEFVNSRNFHSQSPVKTIGQIKINRYDKANRKLFHQQKDVSTIQCGAVKMPLSVSELLTLNKIKKIGILHNQNQMLQKKMFVQKEQLINNHSRMLKLISQFSTVDPLTDRNNSLFQVKQLLPKKDISSRKASKQQEQADDGIYPKLLENTSILNNSQYINIKQQEGSSFKSKSPLPRIEVLPRPPVSRYETPALFNTVQMNQSQKLLPNEPLQSQRSLEDNEYIDVTRKIQQEVNKVKAKKKPAPQKITGKVKLADRKTGISPNDNFPLHVTQLGQPQSLPIILEQAQPHRIMVKPLESSSRQNLPSFGQKQIEIDSVEPQGIEQVDTISRQQEITRQISDPDNLNLRHIETELTHQSTEMLAGHMYYGKEGDEIIKNSTFKNSARSSELGDQMPQNINPSIVIYQQLQRESMKSEESSSKLTDGRKKEDSQDSKSSQTKLVLHPQSSSQTRQAGTLATGKIIKGSTHFKKQKATQEIKEQVQKQFWNQLQVNEIPGDAFAAYEGEMKPVLHENKIDDKYMFGACLNAITQIHSNSASELNQISRFASLKNIMKQQKMGKQIEANLSMMKDQNLNVKQIQLTKKESGDIRDRQTSRLAGWSSNRQPKKKKKDMAIDCTLSKRASQKNMDSSNSSVVSSQKKTEIAKVSMTNSFGRTTQEFPKINLGYQPPAFKEAKDELDAKKEELPAKVKKINLQTILDTTQVQSKLDCDTDFRHLSTLKENSYLYAGDSRQISLPQTVFNSPSGKKNKELAKEPEDNYQLQKSKKNSTQASVRNQSGNNEKELAYGPIMDIKVDNSTNQKQFGISSMRLSLQKVNLNKEASRSNSTKSKRIQDSDNHLSKSYNTLDLPKQAPSKILYPKQRSLNMVTNHQQQFKNKIHKLQKKGEEVLNSISKFNKRVSRNQQLEVCKTEPESNSFCQTGVLPSTTHLTGQQINNFDIPIAQNLADHSSSQQPPVSSRINLNKAESEELEFLGQIEQLQKLHRLKKFEMNLKNLQASLDRSCNTNPVIVSRETASSYRVKQSTSVVKPMNRISTQPEGPTPVKRTSQHNKPVKRTESTLKNAAFQNQMYSLKQVVGSGMGKQSSSSLQKLKLLHNFNSNKLA